MIRRTLLFAATLCGSMLLVASSTAAESTTLYVVELLVLRNLEAGYASPEGPIAPTSDSDEEATPPGRFTRLEWDELRLDSIWDALARSKNFKPVFRAGWVQPGLDGDDARALRISGALNGGGRIAGTAELVRSRYLHLKLDMTVTGPDGASYTLTERRRMRSNNLNYFDNPYFGVIARITRE